MAHVLIVEDTPHNLELMAYLLGAAGHKLSTARTGAEALATLRDERPDLVVLDIQLPDTTGYAVLAGLRGVPDMRSVPVVAVTAYAMVGDRAVGMAAGFDAYLAKPIDPRTFAETVDRLLPEPLRGRWPSADPDEG